MTKKTEKKELFREGLSTVKLLGQLETEENDDFWVRYWEEIMERSPFQGLGELIDNADGRIDTLEKELKQVKNLLRTHKHLDGKPVIEF